MSLRKMLGADVHRVHERVDALLNGEDAMIVLVDGSRAISYAHGFAASPDQLELLALEIERAVRRVAGPPMNRIDASGPRMLAETRDACQSLWPLVVSPMQPAG